MILICGIPSEPPIALAISAAERMQVDFAVFNQRHAEFCDAFLEIRHGRTCGALRIGSRDWPFEAFSGVYTRLIENSALPENQSHGRTPPDSKKVRRSAFLHEILHQWLEVAECNVVNRAAAMASNGSKPYQAQLIRQSGFLIPATLITNDPEEVRTFLHRHRRLVYKSMSSIRSIVEELSQQNISQLFKIRQLPTQFQEYVAGVNVRVHVVGNTVFATKIISDSIDYRYAERTGFTVEMEPCHLPDEIAERCCALAAQLNLGFCGIDLKVTPQAQYYCFEVNPSPAYSYYEEQTGQPISNALISYLAGNDS